MARTKLIGGAGNVEIPSAHYEAMVDTMKELAARNANTEAIVLRCAKAGGVKEVVKHIIWMRNYMKKHAKPQPAHATEDGEDKPKGKKKGKKKRTSGMFVASPAGTDADVEHAGA